MFEPAGDTPGEQKRVVERLNMKQRYQIEGAMGDLFMNDDGVGAFLVGIGATKPAISMLTLGQDPRFDLRETYFLIAGIAGVDPCAGTLGTVAWAKYVVDGNLAFDIDPREIPRDWDTGLFPLGANKPWEMPDRSEDGIYLKDELIELNGELRDWAYEQSKDIKLPDTDAMKALRLLYTEDEFARAAPQVIKGDILAAERFWHGKYHTEWARKWVKLWTEGKGTYVTTNMDDMGTLRGLQHLDKIGKADFSRVLVLRAASNFCMQAPGKTAVENMTAEGSEEDRYPGYLPSLEGLSMVCECVVKQLAQR